MPPEKQDRILHGDHDLAGVALGVASLEKGAAVLGLARFARVRRQAFTRPEQNLGVQPKRDRIGALPFNLDPESLGTGTQAFNKDPSSSDVARPVLGSALQSGTISNYEGVVRDFKNFTLEQGYGVVPTENNVSHFLLYLEKNSVTDSYISKVKAALTMYEEWLNIQTTAFMKPVTRILDGVKNLAISRKAR